jgi:hypothetical protein
MNDKELAERLRRAAIEYNDAINACVEATLIVSNDVKWHRSKCRPYFTLGRPGVIRKEVRVL